MAEYSKGDKVRVATLLRPDLNGKEGTVVDVKTVGGRKHYTVSFGSDSENAELLGEELEKQGEKPENRESLPDRWYR